MNWFPKKTKYTKVRKGRIQSFYKKNSYQNQFGMYAIQAMEPGKITGQQLEAVRRTLTNKTKRQVNIWIRIFPDVPVTAKPTEMRMGRGKGNVSHWVAKVQKGMVLLEISGKDSKVILEALRISLNKLPLKTKIIRKYEELN